MPDRFDNREDITFDPNHPSFVRGGEAWAHGAPLTENPFERWEYNWKAWNAGWVDADSGWRAERNGRVWRLPLSPYRWKERSRTLQGIADAMAEQWLDDAR